MNKKPLQSLLFVLFFLSSFSILFAQWARTYGGSDEDYAWCIQETSDGGYIVTGYTFSFAAQDSDIWILKLSSEGEVEWERTYRVTLDDEGHFIQETSDGGYIVVGYTEFYSFGWTGDIWILKLDSSGSREWQRTYGGSGEDDAWCIQETSDGGYIVAGYTYSFGAGSSDAWVLKLFSDGVPDWQRTYGGGDWDFAYSIQQTDDGGYIVGGHTSSFGVGMGDAWVLKLFSDGVPDWQHTYGGGDWDNARCIQQSNDGGYIVAGSTFSFGAGWSDAWVLKLFSDGVPDWQHTYGGSEWDYAYSIQQTSDGGYIVGGETSSYGAGNIDSWVLKLNSIGSIEWERTYGGNNDDWAFSIRQTSDGGYIGAGTASPINSFGAGMGDFLVLKLYSDGDIDPFCGIIESSFASITNTPVSAADTNVTAQNTNATTSAPNVSPSDTNATVYLLCEAPKYTLSIFAGSGGTTDPVPGSHTYYDGIEVSVTAIPNTGYRFSNWSGDASGTDNPLSITMDSDKSITANFTVTGGGGGDTGGGGGCFIATAAYGSHMHSCVKVLRDFRDKYLMPNKLGRELNNLYYRYSPFVAYLISKHKALKIVVRIHLLPFVVFSYAMLHFGPIITTLILVFIFMLPLLLVSCRRKKLK